MVKTVRAAYRARVILRLRPQVGIDERGLPVVGVDDVEGLDGGEQVQGGATEAREALGIVGICGVGRPVEVVAIERLGVLDEVDRDVGAERGLRGESTVAGHDDGDVMAQVIEGFGEGGDHVGEASRLGEGHEFRGDDGDAEAFLRRGERTGWGFGRLRGCRHWLEKAGHGGDLREEIVAGFEVGESVLVDCVGLDLAGQGVEAVEMILVRISAYWAMSPPLIMKAQSLD